MQQRHLLPTYSDGCRQRDAAPFAILAKFRPVCLQTGNTRKRALTVWHSKASSWATRSTAACGGSVQFPCIPSSGLEVFCHTHTWMSQSVGTS
jgi:hypothetical protein